MKSFNRQKFLFYFTLLCLFSIAAIPTAFAQKTYTVGIVPQFEPRKLRAIWIPILKSIEKQTGLHLVIRGSPTIPEFEKELNAGMYDFAYMNPYHIMLANQNQGYIPLVRDTGRKLFGILVVRLQT